MLVFAFHTQGLILDFNTIHTSRLKVLEKYKSMAKADFLKMSNSIRKTTKKSPLFVTFLENGFNELFELYLHILNFDLSSN